MARRPVFIPEPYGAAPVRTEYVDFTWHSGLALSQKRKSITALHDAAYAQLKLRRVLEVSSKSAAPLGVALSAFNLAIRAPGMSSTLCVECAFQGSKVFELGGPYKDIFGKTARDAKRDPRLQSSGHLLRFHFMGRDWGLEPQSAFYDWLYIKALSARADLIENLTGYQAFTDIEFNPDRSINCQAYSVALFLSLHRAGLLARVTHDEDSFLDFISSRQVNNARQDDGVQGRLL